MSHGVCFLSIISPQDSRTTNIGYRYALLTFICLNDLAPFFILMIFFPSFSLVALNVVLMPARFVSLRFVSNELAVRALFRVSLLCGIIFLSFYASSHLWAHFLEVSSLTYLGLLSLFHYSSFCCLMLHYLQRYLDFTCRVI